MDLTISLQCNIQIFYLVRGDPQVRDPTELPIIVHDSDNERKVLWAKMDTGADLNIIGMKYIDKLGFSHLIQGTQSSSSALHIAEIGGKTIDIARKISLSFTAGRKNTVCQDIEF